MNLASVFFALLLILPASLGAAPLDERLTEENRSGSHELSTARVDPLLVQAIDGGAGAPVAAIAVHEPDATPVAEHAYRRHGVEHLILPRLEMAILELDADRLDALASESAIRSLWAAPENEMLLDDAAPTAGATTAWADFGVSGAGVGVVVTDTGVDGLHPDLEKRIVGNWFYGLDSWLDAVAYTDTSPSAAGHGTAVIGTLAGTGTALGPNDPSHGRYIGIAPGSDIISCTGAFGLATLVCFERALVEHEEFGIRVSSNSWGNMGPPYDPEHPTNIASLALYRAGIAVVFGGGNSGTPSGCDGTMNTYASAPWALSVAAADKDLRLATFSSQGTDPGMCGDPFDHPTITAPGVSINAAKARAGAIQATSPFFYEGDLSEFDVEGSASYGYVSGTSIAAPIVAGALALMFEANPELAPDQAYDILVATARPLAHGYSWWQAGAGLIDVHAAVEMAIATPGTLDAFLAGERRYDDPLDATNEPLKRFITENGPPAGPSQPEEVPTLHVRTTDRFRFLLDPGVHEVRIVANETFVLSEILHGIHGDLVTVIHPEGASFIGDTCGGLPPGVFAHRGPRSAAFPLVDTDPTFPAGNYTLLLGTDHRIEVKIYVNAKRDTVPLEPLPLVNTRATDHTVTFLAHSEFDLTEGAPLSAHFMRPLTLAGPSMVLTEFVVNPDGAGFDDMHIGLRSALTPCAAAHVGGPLVSTPLFGPFRILDVAGTFPGAGEIEWNGDYTLTAGTWATSTPSARAAVLTTHG